MAADKKPPFERPARRAAARARRHPRRGPAPGPPIGAAATAEGAWADPPATGWGRFRPGRRRQGEPRPDSHPPGRSRAAGRRARRTARARRPAARLPWLLLAPAAAALLGVLGWALLRTLAISFQDFGRRELITHATVWAGLDNYRAVLADARFWDAVGRTFAFTAVNVLLIMVLGTLTGLLLARLHPAPRLLLAASLVAAWAMPVIASTTVFRWLFDTQFGLVNWVLSGLGLAGYEQHDWFASGTSTLAIATALIVWGSVPFVALTFYAGLTTVDGDILQAARVDGASAWRVFWSVLLPMLRPFFLITAFLETIWVFKAFPEVYALGGGGPGRRSETLPVMAYIEGMGQTRYGVAGAISVLTLLILLAVTAGYFRLVLAGERAERVAS